MKQITQHYKQSGVVILALLLIIISGSAYLLITKFNQEARKSADYEKSVNVLAEAKRALIAYAVNYYDLNAGEFGILPCPDVNFAIGEEGNQDPNCGSQHENSIGKLPWQTLGLEPLKDAYGQCLWYAVSGAYKNNPSPKMLNEDTHGTFQIMAADGTPMFAMPEDRPVAVIFAPSRPVSTQNRPAPITGTICGGDYNPSNYLDSFPPSPPPPIINNAVISGVPDTIDQFIVTNDPDNDHVNNFNDLLVYITADEIWDAIKKRNDFIDKFYDVTDTDLNNLTRKVAECIANYGLSHPDPANNNMPWPAPLILADYRNNDNYDDIDGSGSGESLFGRVPNIIDDSNDEIGDTSQPNLITDCADFDEDTSTGALSLEKEQELLKLWENWKDHLFYAVADIYQPNNAPTNPCGDGLRCLTINQDLPSPVPAGFRDYAAVVIFSNSISAGQNRSSPPIDSDQKGIITNYLEDLDPMFPFNTADYIDMPGDDTKRYDYTGGTGAINDILYCINDNDGGPDTLAVTICPNP